MPLEAGTLIPDMDANNPLGSDPKSEGDDHIRLVKRCTLGTFPAFVGTTATPKTVTLTEDQINDAALKSEANSFSQTQTFNALTSFNSAPRLANNIPLHGRNAALNDTLVLIKLDDSDRMIVGDDARVFSAIYHAESHRFLGIDGDAFSSTTKAAGSLLVRDISNATKKAGFRNPTFTSLANADHTAVLDDEAQVLSFSGTGNTIILPNLGVGTTISIINRAGGDNFVEAGATLGLQWLDGAGGPSAIPGTVTLAQGSIVTVYQIFSNQWEIWGNGISN